MSKAMQLVGIILLGIFTLVIINLMSDVRSTSELDYYLAQEITEAAMYDAVDYAYYRNTGLLKVDRDMFLENFNRRFATSVDNNRNYEISIVDFNEVPPKVSVEIKANTVSTIKGENAVINVKVSGILETIYDDLVMSRGQYEEITSLDVKAPTIDKSFDGKSFNITISDSESHLDKFCYVYLDKEVVAASANLISSGQTCDNSVFGKSSANFSHSEYVDNDYNEWIVVYDISGNTTWEPLTNETKPWVAKVKYESENLIFTLKGFSKITDYYISIDEPTINNSNWKKVPNNNEINNVWTTTVNINNFLREQAKDGEHTYYIFGRDINGIITKPRSIKILRNLGSSPQIDSIDFVSNENNLYLKISDIDGDLSKYLIKKDDDSKPSANADWINVKNGYVETIQENIESRGSGTYYIWVKDSKNNVTSTSLSIHVAKVYYNLTNNRNLEIKVDSDSFHHMDIRAQLYDTDGNFKQIVINEKSVTIKSKNYTLGRNGNLKITVNVYEANGNPIIKNSTWETAVNIPMYKASGETKTIYNYYCADSNYKLNGSKCEKKTCETKTNYLCERYELVEKCQNYSIKGKIGQNEHDICKNLAITKPSITPPSSKVTGVNGGQWGWSGTCRVCTTQNGTKKETMTFEKNKNGEDRWSCKSNSYQDCKTDTKDANYTTTTKTTYSCPDGGILINVASDKFCSFGW